MRKGKAYAKGPHLSYMMKRRGYTGRQYSQAEITAADRLLRLELTLGHHWLARHPENWYDLTPHQLQTQWDQYFNRMIGDAAMTNDATVKQRIHAAAATEGQGRAAYGCWLMIQSEGMERAEQSYTRSSWYRHLGVLRRAGLGDADLSAGKVVHLRRQILDARLVNDWSELLAA